MDFDQLSSGGEGILNQRSTVPTINFAELSARCVQCIENDISGHRPYTGYLCRGVPLLWFGQGIGPGGPTVRLNLSSWSVRIVCIPKLCGCQQESLKGYLLRIQIEHSIHIID